MRDVAVTGMFNEFNYFIHDYLRHPRKSFVFIGEKNAYNMCLYIESINKTSWLVAENKCRSLTSKFLIQERPDRALARPPWHEASTPTQSHKNIKDKTDGQHWMRWG